MIFDIGIDIVSVERFKNKPFFKNKIFYTNIFSENEIKYCKKFRNPYIHFAGRFAAKEAIKKATNRNFKFNEIEILNDFSGKPQIKNLGETILISIAHEKTFAIAMCIKF